MDDKYHSALEQAIAFMGWLANDPLLDGEDCLMEVKDIQEHARIELESILKKVRESS